ncbi:MAG: class I SAM-dependent methyltransferase [Sulfuritalea sp.]|nr:class I SAM-dependent methyltransferase [Sulfuritalea sp.]
MACPCCGNASTSRDEALRLPDACPACGHRWQSTVAVTPSDYRTQQHRNDTNSPGHQDKLSDRLRDIGPLLNAGMHILEIGCAEGSLGQLVRGVKDVTYTGVELSADAESAARLLNRVIRSPANSIAGESFNLLLSFHVLEHIEDIAGELAHWRRLLVDGGSLLVEVPNQAGHRLLSMDPNLEHIHQFTPSSLTALLHHAGFEVQRLETGHWESSVYSDSLRVLARPALSDAQRRTRLLQRFLARLPEPFAAWGIGGDFRGYVEPLLDSLPVAALVDNAAQRHGERHGHLVVEAYDPLRHEALPILVCSVRHREEILHDLASLGIAASRIVTLDDIFGTSES